MLLAINYAQNYASIIGKGIATEEKKKNASNPWKAVELTRLSTVTFLEQFTDKRVFPKKLPSGNFVYACC